MEVKPGYKQTEIGLIPEEWSLAYVEDIAYITTGSRNTQDRVDDGQYPFFVRSQTVERINSYSFDGEAILTAGDGVGTGKVFHYINGKFDTHQRVYRMSDFSDMVNGYFFYLYFSNNFYSRIMQMTAKSSVDSVRRDMIARMLIPLPPTLAEQEAIAGALSDADALIESLEQLIAKKRMVKQGAMQELLTGKRRLPGFETRAGYKQTEVGEIPEDWEVSPLPEIIWFQEGPGIRKWQFRPNGLKVINVTNLQENGYLDLSTTERYISWEECERSYKHFLVDNDDVVIASSGNSYCKTAVVREHDLPLLMNTSVIRFKAKERINRSFMLIYLKSRYFKEQIDLLITGGAQPNFGPAHLRKVIIPLPSNKDEQEAIASFLSDMDADIAALEDKLAKVQQVKQGMTQELLTGRIRLI